jgi:hypothetical protein
MTLIKLADASQLVKSDVMKVAGSETADVHDVVAPSLEPNAEAVVVVTVHSYAVP